MRTWRGGRKPIGSSQNMHVKNIVFGTPSAASIGRPNDNLGANGVLRNLLSYSFTNSSMCSTIILQKTLTQRTHWRLVQHAVSCTESVRHYG